MQCPKCAGCGQIANSTDQEPWCYWEELSPANRLVVTEGIVGIVTSLPCPRCGGTGKEADPMREAKQTINELCDVIHAENKKWWLDLKTGEELKTNPFFAAAKLMLIVSEIAEAVEGHRKNLNDDKLPHRPMVEVELADAVIRIFDFAGGHGYDLGGAIVEKLQYNRTRADHTTEGRLAQGGKSY